MMRILCMLLVAIWGCAHASVCPDPQTTSLKWGIPPEPWQDNPYSPQRPHEDEHTRFYQANILQAGFGRGVVCYYETSQGRYSIWWQVRVRLPSPLETQWVADYGGFSCQLSRQDCQFTTIH